MQDIKTSLIFHPARPRYCHQWLIFRGYSNLSLCSGPWRLRPHHRKFLSARQSKGPRPYANFQLIRKCADRSLCTLFSSAVYFPLELTSSGRSTERPSSTASHQPAASARRTAPMLLPLRRAHFMSRSRSAVDSRIRSFSVFLSYMEKGPSRRCGCPRTYARYSGQNVNRRHVCHRSYSAVSEGFAQFVIPLYRRAFTPENQAGRSHFIPLKSARLVASPPPPWSRASPPYEPSHFPESTAAFLVTTFQRPIFRALRPVRVWPSQCGGGQRGSGGLRTRSRCGSELE